MIKSTPWNFGVSCPGLREWERREMPEFRWRHIHSGSQKRGTNLFQLTKEILSVRGSVMHLNKNGGENEFHIDHK